MTLAELLADKELADDQEISLGDKGTFKLSELRGVATERDTFRTEREKVAAERDDFRGKFNKQSETLTELLGDAHKRALDDVNAPPPKSGKDQLRELLTPLLESDDGTKALFEDKVFGKALNTVEERAYQRAKKDYEELASKFSELDGNVKKGFEGMTVAQLNERAERWYGNNRADVPKGDDGKKLSMQSIHQYGMERNMVRPGTQLIDYDRVLEVLTEPARSEARMSEAEKRGFEKGLEQGRLAAGKVIPIFGDRSAGSAPGDKISTVGKSAKQIVTERLQQGLSDLSAAENE
jgi:hypothetical protein